MSKLRSVAKNFCYCSVDSVTEGIMQNVIDTDFAEHTVIAVVHRLGYIRHFDKIAFLQAGELLEFDSPDALLTRNSAFADLYKSMSHLQNVLPMIISFLLVE